jgi:hypothetical protein
MKRAFASTALCFSLASAGGLAACEGCHAPSATDATSADAEAPKPTVRLYVLSTVAGALEPCGCTKDQLGGIDHLAAFIEAEQPAAPNSLVVAAGPLFFMDPIPAADRATQNLWNAEAIAAAAKDIQLAAWAPGANDWAAGAQSFSDLGKTSGATVLAGNLDGASEAKVVVVGGMKVGLIGVSQPRDRKGALPDGVKEDRAPLEAMRAGLEIAKRGGARVFVGLAAIPRGDAKRLVDAMPELNVLVLGKPSEGGDANDAPKPPELAGTTLLVEASNHLQTVGVVDLFVRDAPASAPIVFADAGGVSKADALISVSSRIRDLELRIDSWERDAKVNAGDITARKADLARLRDEKAKLEATETPKEGSFFLYRSVEVREGLGTSTAVAKEMLDYYKRVNDHNKVALADRVAPPPPDGQASYLGVEACTTCHEEARKVWDSTPHSHAYATLEKGFKEYNLDCVSCHVTGYGKPGGSTVTHNDKLRDVGCEECHGPGSLHVKSPNKKGLVIAKPDLASCVSGCHHPPHVEQFDAAVKVKNILGPGHGQ